MQFTRPRGFLPGLKAEASSEEPGDLPGSAGRRWPPCSPTRWTGFAAQQDEAQQQGERQNEGQDERQELEGGKYGGPGNLWAPADGPHGRDFGAHGRFDDEAVSDSPQDWVSRNRARMGAGALAAAGLGALVTAGLRRGRGRDHVASS
ncbi:hypothetical protein [Streptomyces sp. NBC_00076]|uniref:hypothetical protein n=1 Tax=Streptomyces sp. NBC_00076 TaxID=2975642 RepID=UPI0038642233